MLMYKILVPVIETFLFLYFISSTRSKTFLYMFSSELVTRGRFLKKVPRHVFEIEPIKKFHNPIDPY